MSSKNGWPKLPSRDGKVHPRSTAHRDEIRIALRAATIANLAQPVFCGSSLQYIGVQRLLDGVIDYLPTPWTCRD